MDRSQTKYNETNKLLQDKNHDYKEMALRLSTDNYSSRHSKFGANWNKEESTATMKSLQSS